MNILITGGTGFIGSHTAVAAIKAGFNVIIIDNLCNSKAEVVDNIEKITGVRPKFYMGDILDTALVKKIFTENKIDAVIHFAGLKAVAESFLRPFEYYKTNVCGTLNLCEIMQKAGCTKLIFSSSATVYGTSGNPPFSETAPTCAINPYGRTKLMCEQIISDICGAKSDFHAVLLRYFNPIGAHESGLIGENPNGTPNNLLPLVARAAKNSAENLSVFGNDYPTKDGTGIRDYIHVCDLAEGHIAALDYVFKNSGAEIVNLGSGTGYSVLEIISAYEAASGRKISYKFMPRRSGDSAVCVADISKAEKLLGWTPKRDLAQMCRDSWRFEVNNK